MTAMAEKASGRRRDERNMMDVEMVGINSGRGLLYVLGPWIALSAPASTANSEADADARRLTDW